MSAMSGPPSIGNTLGATPRSTRTEPAWLNTASRSNAFCSAPLCGSNFELVASDQAGRAKHERRSSAAMTDDIALAGPCRRIAYSGLWSCARGSGGEQLDRLPDEIMGKLEALRRAAPNGPSRSARAALKA